MRKLLLLMIAVIPFSPLKRALYRLCFGYHIGAGTRLGMVFLDAKHVHIGANCRLHHFVAVRRVGNFTLGDGCEIGPGNLFSTDVKQDFYKYAFTAGARVFLSRSHRYDLSENIVVGEETIIGGVSGALWTHGAWKVHQPIEIGKKCFVSDGVLIMPGVKLGDNVLVGAGAMVNGPMNYPSDCTLIGNPARVVQRDTIWWQNTGTAQSRAAAEHDPEQ